VREFRQAKILSVGGFLFSVKNIIKRDAMISFFMVANIECLIDR